MEEQLFIPKKLKVGFQKRNDTYTKKLAYVIYYDSKGVLRKQTSWDGWRDKKIEPIEVDNVPHSGFVINKDVQRNSSYFGDGGGRNMIRVYDDRGIEFEITTGNLVFILMTTNCHKRGLEGEFVYSWYGKELILLPTGCDEYKKAQLFTQIQGKSLSKKDLIPGCAYTTKKLETLIYLGNLPWRELKYNYSKGIDDVIVAKKHVFVNENPYDFDIDEYDYEDDYEDDNLSEEDFNTPEEYKNYLQELEDERLDREELENEKKGENVKPKFLTLANTNTLSVKISDTPVCNYAELMQNFAKTKHAASPLKFEDYSKEIELVVPKRITNYTKLRGIFYVKDSENKYSEYKISPAIKHGRNYSDVILIPGKWELEKQGTFKVKKGQIVKEDTYSENRILTEQQVKKMNFVNLFVNLDNGEKVKINEYFNN